MLKFSYVMLLSSFLNCGTYLILKPETPAFVKKGQRLELTCQSNESGLFEFYTFDEWIKKEYAYGGGSFKECLSTTNQTALECHFEDILTFKLTLINPKHNQTVYCRRSFNRLTLSTSTTVFVQVPISTLTLSSPQSTVMTSRSINITCVTNDLIRPAANITWYKGTFEISSHVTTTIRHGVNDTFTTFSVLQYTGVEEDNGQQVYCRASNIEGEYVESNRYTLNVKYIAEVQTLPVNSLEIVAGTKQVWIYCHVTNANPENISYRWTRSNSHETAVVSSAQMYIIDSAVEKDTGKYTCIAMNSAGSSSGTVDIYVQSKPMKPTITLVECDVNNATILWTIFSPLNFGFIPPLQQETLQLGEQNDVYSNCSYEKFETNQSYVYIYRVTDLNPSTGYRFRVVTSNGYGYSFSDSRTCYTDEEVLISKSKDCDKGLIIGGSLGGAVILIIFSGGFAFFINLQINRKKQQTAEQNDHYVHRFCSTTDHQYQDISTENKELNIWNYRTKFIQTTNGNKITIQSQFNFV